MNGTKIKELILATTNENKTYYNWCKKHECEKRGKGTNTRCETCLIEKSHLKFTNVNIDEWVECKVCGMRLKELGVHLINVHNINTKEYRKEGNYTKCKIARERIKGEKNPGFNHNGRMSAWSKNFKNGYDEGKHIQAKENHKKYMSENKDKSMFRIDYWIKQAEGDTEEAQKLYKKSQTRSLEWFINKFGLIEGPIRHQSKTEKWMKSFKKCNFSKISQILFDEIYNNLNDKDEIYYATLDREDMKKYFNKEYIFKTNSSYIRPDFICLSRKKIIEFDGTYWHSPRKANILRDQFRDDKILEKGFQVLHILEYDFEKDKEGIIQKCLNFLNK